MVRKQNKRIIGLEKIFRLFICILPGVLFFSYWPVIHFGSSESMNFEISLPLIWLVVFDLLVIVMGWRKKEFWRGIIQRWMWLLLPLWLSVSVLWSLNPVRGLLTVGILWLIYLAVYGMWYQRDLLKCGRFRDVFWKVFWGSTLVVCAWCIVQCVLDIVGVPRRYSLMCEGCTYAMFGFPHPNGFAIEPQFMGNLLLAPVIVVMWFIVKPQSIKKLKLERSRGVVLTTGQADSAPNCSSGSSSVPVVKTTTGSRFLGSNFLILCGFIITFTLFLTFSRGAIYAFLMAMVVMSGWVIVDAWRTRQSIVKKKKRVTNTESGIMWQGMMRVLRVWGIVIGAFVAALATQGLMAELSPTNDTFQSGVAKVVNQLTLGKIDIRGGEGSVSDGPIDGAGLKVEPLEENDKRDTNADSARVSENDKRAVFDGYVAESTDTRLRLTGAALEVWGQDAKTMLLGVGLGGAGQALYDNGLSPAPKEIVQNQYASLLLETGVVGVGLMALTIVLILRVVWKSNVRMMLICLMVAYGVTLLFFSGLPNALHVYLLLALLMYLYD